MKPAAGNASTWRNLPSCSALIHPQKGGVQSRMQCGCKTRYAVLFQIWTFPSKPEDEAHIGPTATYDEVIYPGFQRDIIALQIQGTTYTIGIQLPEYITSAEGTCLNTDYNQVPNGKGKTHHAHIHTGLGSRSGTPS